MQPNSAERLFWINIKYATFGIVAIDGIIVASPPIAGWMRYKRLPDIKSWLRQHNAIVIEVNEHSAERFIKLENT